MYTIMLLVHFKLFFFLVDSGDFMIEKQGDSTKQLVLRNGMTATFDVSGPEISFTPEGTTTGISGITSADVSALTSKATPVYVASREGNSYCLKLDGTYHDGQDASACANQLWYFVLCKFGIHFKHLFNLKKMAIYRIEFSS